MLTVITGGTVIDPVTGEHIENATVVIEGATIREVGPSGSSPTNLDNAIEIDARGKWLVPGLIDSHVHLSIPRGKRGWAAEGDTRTHASLSMSAAYGLNNAQTLLDNGVTTVRDVGSHGHSIFGVKRLIDSGIARGTRIVACGEAIIVTGGHWPIGSAEADGPDGVRKLARTQLHAGAGALKFMASAGASDGSENPYDVELTQEELAAGIEEAHARGKPAAVHAVNPEAARRAVLAGADTIEHGVLLDDDSLRLMRAHDVALVPTLWTYRRIAELGEVLGWTKAVIGAVERRLEPHLAVVSRAHEAGVTILGGTDGAHTPFNPPRSLHWELAWLVAAGLSPLEALRAATSDAAKSLRRESHLGTLTAGKIADVVVLDGDPTADIRNLERVDTVIKDGVICVRSGKSVGPAWRDPEASPDGPRPDLTDGGASGESSAQAG